MGFRANAAAFLKNYPGQSISLATRDGRQLMNTRHPPTANPLPPRHQPAFDRGGVLDRQAGLLGPVHRLGDAQPHHHRQRSGDRGGQVVYEMSFNPPLEMFQRIIHAAAAARRLDDVDLRPQGRQFRARAQSGADDRTARGRQRCLPALLAGDEGKLLTTVSREGVALNTAFTRSPLTGWKVAAGTPVAALTAPLWRELAITASIGGILLVVGLFFAIGMATRIARGEMLHDLLINELNHRVKNTLATVQSIASQTLRRTDNPAEAIDKFSAAWCRSAAPTMC